MVPLVVGRTFSLLFALRPSSPPDSGRRRWRTLATALALAPILLMGAAAELQAQPQVTNYAWTGDSSGYVIFDRLTQQTSATLSAKPNAVAYAPDGSVVYLAEASTGNLSLYNPRIDYPVFLATIPAGLNDPHGIVISADGSTAYIADTADDEVVVVNLLTQTVTTSIQDVSLTGPRGIVLSPDGADLYVTSASSAVVKISTATNTVVGSVPTLSAPTDIVVTPDGLKLFVAEPALSQIRVIDATTMAVTNAIAMGGSCAQLAITPDGTRIFAPMQSSFNLIAIDVENESVITAVHMTETSDEWAVDVTPDGASVIVAGKSAQHFVVVNPATTSFVSKVSNGRANEVFGRFLSPSYLLTGQELEVGSDADLTAHGFRNHVPMIAGTLLLEAPWTTAKNLSGHGLSFSDYSTLDTNGFDATISGALTGFMAKQGAGTLTLDGTHAGSGELTIGAGALVLTGAHAGDVYAVSSSTVRGTGTVDGLLGVDSSTISPGVSGPGILTAGSFNLLNGSTLAVALDGTTPGTGYSQILVTGTTNLGGGSSVLSVTLGYTPAPGDQFTIVTNRDSGTFSGLAEGSFFAVGGTMFHITYVGGDGNDVVLTANAAPTLAALGNLTIDEDNGQQLVNLTIGDDLTSADNLTVTASSSNTALVANGSLSLSGIGTARTLQFASASNEFGSTTITVRVTDGAAAYFERTFDVTVTAVNDPPTMAALGPQAIDEDGTLGPITVTVGDIDSTVADLVVTGTSSDQSIVADGAITSGGSGANRTISLTPVADANGPVTITVTVSDGEDRAQRTFVLTINAVNDAPTVAPIAPQTVDEDVTAGPIAITVDDVDNAVGGLAVTATSSYQGLVYDAGITLGGSGANRTIALTPRPDENGSTTITVTVSDGIEQTQTTFLLTVNPVNDAPTISAIAPQTIDEDTSLGPLSFTVSDIDDDRLTLVVTATSSNQALVPDANLTVVPCANCAAPDPVWTISATPVPDGFGETTITVTVSDGHAHTDTTFRLTVTDVEDPPPPTITYYLAEGATGAFFDTDLLIANPNPVPAPVTITFMRADGSSVVETRDLLATSRTTIQVDAIEGLEEATFSTVVTSTAARPLAVERTMRWDATGYGAHTEKATDGAASTWYFAEGAQGWFSTYLLLANPQETVNRATVTWLRAGEPALVRSYPLAPASRATVDASQDLELAGRTFGARVAFDQPGVAERTMYFGSTPVWLGGHAAAGATATAQNWYLAEGATGSYFTTFVLLANPGEQAAEVVLTYLPESGDPVSVPVTLQAGQRETRNIAEEHPSLASASVATSITSTQPIVVERAQYWGQPAWIESHNSVGVTEPGRRWALAEGRVGGDDGAQTYILLANPGGDAADVTLTFLRTDGTTIEKTVQVPAARRVTVGITGDPQGLVPELTAETFGTRIDSAQPIVVERSLYSNANGVIWAAGTNATATALPQPH